jgi:hypothetical protein
MKNPNSIGKRSRRQVSGSRQIVFERDNNTCVVELSEWSFRDPCAGILTLQHAVTRGMGGSALWDSPAYLRAMCWHHNDIEPRDANFRRYCEDNGWSIPRWVLNSTPIERIPVRYPDSWYLLYADQRTPIDESIAKDLMQEIYGEH